MPTSPPYLYNNNDAAQSHYSLVNPYNDFDPKAATRASWTPAPSRLQTEGALVNFNRHPDSWAVIPTKTEAEPLPAHLKKTIKSVRWVQFALRTMQMLGALGLLFCIIVIKNTAVTEGYIIRVPAAVDILTTGYALYHLQRPAKGRTPASSSSYHIFASIIDVSIVPFYVFTVLATRSNSALPANDQDRWTSFFDTSATAKIVLTTWLISIAVGGLHVITAGISVYLAVMFRRIANMPPDMNPLEDNLTSRRLTKHKYKDSELSLHSAAPTLVGSTQDLTNSGRSSPIKDQMTEHARPVSFLRTRMDSDVVYSPHNPVTAEASRSSAQIPAIPKMYLQPKTSTAPHVELPRQMGFISDTRSEAQSKRSHGFMSEPSTRAQPLSASSSVYSRASTTDTDTPNVPRKSSKRFSFTSDNWFVYDGEAKDNKEPQVHVVDEQMRGPGIKKLGKTYQPLAQHQDYESDWKSASRETASRDSFVPMPLGMNPPSPPHNSTWSSPKSRNSKPLGVMSGNVSSPSTPRKSIGMPKNKYYGDLNSAMQGVRGLSPQLTPGTSPSPQKYRNSPDRGQSAWPGSGGKSGRVVSRSGVDEGRGQRNELRGRGVSGKFAEEGRAGVGWRAWE